jgi:hypothetical protein
MFEYLTVDMKMPEQAFELLSVEVYSSPLGYAVTSFEQTNLDNEWIRYVFAPAAPEPAGAEILLMFNFSEPVADNPVRIDNMGFRPAHIGTAFTYQGKLNDQDDPAEGEYDFQFKLFDAQGGGNQLGATLTLTGEDTPVTQGYFTRRLDFGDAFYGEPRWLEIAVRPGDSTGEYTTLLPRQKITPAPYAIHANQAGHAGTADQATHADHAASADQATFSQQAAKADHASQADQATSAVYASQADQAQYANRAGTANSSENADYASSAGSAQHADHADQAEKANRADYARDADNADYAQSASTADYAKDGPYTAAPPLNISGTHVIGLNPATNPGDLLTWDGDNWIAAPFSYHQFTINNMQPYLGLNYCIALQGLYPPRNGAEPYIGEIMIFAGNFAPRNYAFCNGQLLPINQNQSLYSILGTTYGGDGRTNFALPDLRGRVPLHPGYGPGLSSRKLGEKGGTETTGKP